MITGRSLIYVLARRQFGLSTQPRLSNHKRILATPGFTFQQACIHQQGTGMAVRGISTHHITKNIEFITEDRHITISGNAIQNINATNNRPLLVILSWLLSKRNHVMKFANLYLEQGFDIAVVSLTPWQLLWPAKGSRLVALDLLTFLTRNNSYQQILLHGFSVGGYMWGEVLDFIQSNQEQYSHITHKIIGQVWDSVADISELTIGTPRAVFPKNEVLQAMLRKYLEYHMKAFHEQATKYYIRSSQLFHTNSLRCPALFFISKTDPVGTLYSNLRVRDQWKSLGVETYVKVFDKSPHVGHFRQYPKEYVAELYAFLNKLNLIQNEKKIRARL